MRGRAPAGAPPHRRILLNQAQQPQKYKGNYVATTKYNLLFVPKALYEQFRRGGRQQLERALAAGRQSRPDRERAPRRRIANLYFTLVAAISCTSISPIRCGGRRAAPQAAPCQRIALRAPQRARAGPSAQQAHAAPGAVLLGPPHAPRDMGRAQRRWPSQPQPQ
jgi:hypothetical protein